MKIYILYYYAIDDGTTYLTAYSSSTKPKVLASIGNQIIKDDFDRMNEEWKEKGFDIQAKPHERYSVKEMTIESGYSNTNRLRDSNGEAHYEFRI